MGYVNYNLKDTEINEIRTNHPEEYRFIKKLEEVVSTCVYCDRVFESSIECIRHMKSEHNKIVPILVVNEKIINDLYNEYYLREVKGFIVHNYLNEEQALFIDGIYIKPEGKSIDLTNLMKEQFNLNKQVIISIGENKIKLLKQSIGLIKNPLIDKTINAWNEAISKGLSVEMIDKRPFNLNEEDYVNAFFEYFIACQAKLSDKTNRYYSAYEKLDELNSDNALSKIVLQVIAYYLNWFNKLSEISSAESSIFSLAVDFYRFKSDLSYCDKVGSSQLFIEDQLSDSIEVIKKYYAGDMAGVDKYIREHSNVEGIEDSNLRDKIIFIKIRRLKDIGQLEKALRLADSITDVDLKLISLQNLK